MKIERPETPEWSPRPMTQALKAEPKVPARPPERGAQSLAEVRATEPENSSRPLSRAPLAQQAGIAAGLLGGPPPPDWSALHPGDEVPAQDGGTPWQVVETERGLRLTRPGPPAAEGPPWTHSWNQGQAGPVTERQVPAHDGRGDWTETLLPLAGIVASRQVPDPAGGPPWNERRDWPTRSRQVPDPDGGPVWNESQNTSTNAVSRSRTVPDPQGGPDWLENVSEDGQRWKGRTYTDAQGRWSETISGNNRWRINLDARQNAKAAGPHETLTVPGPGGQSLNIEVYGATAEELDRIRRRLEALPPELRVNTGDIVVADNIGQILDAQGNMTSRIAGLGGPVEPGRDGITLDRATIGSDSDMDYVLYHEMGHVQDYRTPGRASGGGTWGDGHSVSSYGGRNALEDYGENHRIVLSNWQVLRGLSREAILQYPTGAKLVEIMDRYGWEYGMGTGSPALVGVEAAPAPPVLLPPPLPPPLPVVKSG